MGGGWSCCLLLSAASLLLAVFAPGTYAGYSSRARGDVRISSKVKTVTFCRLNMVPVCQSSGQLLTDSSAVENLIVIGSSGFLSLKSSTRTPFRRQSFQGIVVDFRNRNDGNPYKILST